MNLIETIIKDVVTSIYPAFISGIIFAVFVMFTINFAREKGYKNIAKQWILNFKNNKNFRLEFYCVFYVFVVLCKTVLTRPYHVSPLSDVIGEWGLYTDKGAINVDPFENFILFIPLTIFIFSALKEKVLNKSGIINILIKSVLISFAVSFFIEIVQVFFKLGTFQLSDLFFNTSGGLLGGIFYCVFKMKNKK